MQRWQKLPNVRKVNFWKFQSSSRPFTASLSAFAGRLAHARAFAKRLSGTPSQNAFAQRLHTAAPHSAFAPYQSAIAKRLPIEPSWSIFFELLLVVLCSTFQSYHRGAPSSSAFAERLRETPSLRRAPSKSAFRHTPSWNVFPERFRGAPSRVPVRNV